MRVSVAIAFFLALGCSCGGGGPRGGTAKYEVVAECDGAVADGDYRATGPGGDRIEGRFCDGARCGAFRYSSGIPNVPVAEFPYRGRRLEGTAKVWYLPHTAPQSPHRKMFVGDFQGGKLHGEMRSWWPSGQLQTAFLYRLGELSSGSAWDPDGVELEPNETFALADREQQARTRLFRALGSIISTNPPRCPR